MGDVGAPPASADPCCAAKSALLLFCSVAWLAWRERDFRDGADEHGRRRPAANILYPSRIRRFPLFFGGLCVGNGWFSFRLSTPLGRRPAVACLDAKPDASRSRRPGRRRVCRAAIGRPGAVAANGASLSQTTPGAAAVAVRACGPCCVLPRRRAFLRRRRAQKRASAGGERDSGSARRGAFSEWRNFMLVSSERTALAAVD
ncbi:hypothetical protein HPB51_011754 [Rhipicephalus microplus]|uniref:Uncharacterized protein n=1 Tax=Rhipicephalus microplus TaxID=6941 RepID=A0A9J6DMF5_RHIMP|nr:hypothetical protein HPB51_011754 [Rhipicephalus microplus]